MALTPDDQPHFDKAFQNYYEYQVIFMFVRAIDNGERTSYQLLGVTDSDDVLKYIYDPDVTLVTVADREPDERDLKNYKAFLKNYHHNGTGLVG